MDLKFRFSFAETYMFLMALVGSYVVGAHIGTTIRLANERRAELREVVTDANTGE